MAVAAHRSSFTHLKLRTTTTLYNVCAVPWGVFSTMGDIMSTVGGYLEYRGVFSTLGDIMINVGDILSTVGVFSTVGDIMSTVRGYLEYRGAFQYHGGYHDAHGGYHEYRGGCSVPWGIPSFEI